MNVWQPIGLTSSTNSGGVSGWTYTLNGEPSLLADRGFTGHEYLPWFKLYNMNGRPVVSSVGSGGVIGGVASGMAGGFTGGFVGGAGNAWLNGAALGQGLTAGMTAGVTSGFISGGIGGLVGVFSSISKGGNFWTGEYSTGSSLAGLDGGGKVYGPFSLHSINVYGNARLGMGVVKSISTLYGIIGRLIMPDFLAIGVGFNGIVGVGAGTTFELRWVTHGPEASWKPMVTITQSIGGGFSIDATLNIEAANYTGNVNNITRSMMQTSSHNGDFPTIWGSG